MSASRCRGGHDFLIGDCNRGHQGRVYRLAEEVGALQQSSERRLSVVDEVLRAQARHRRLRRPGFAAALLLLAVVASLRLGPSSHPSEARTVTVPWVATVTRTGAVTGYIQPCDGLGVPLHTSTGARLFSAAATIEALRGHEYLKPVGHGTYRLVFPAVVAARESVAQNQQFRIDHLAPGRYVIWARYAGGNVSTFLDVSVAAGKVADIDLPNVCM